MEPLDQVHGLGEDSRDLDSSLSTAKAHTQAVPPSPRRLALDSQARSAAAAGQQQAHALAPPSRQPSPAIVSSEPAGCTQQQQQPPLERRLPSTPPLSRSHKFLTRPYRRTTDGHHHTHHLHPFGSGTTSSGVRSAFKDFVVPAQIILLCSILNATWPLLTSFATTALEFLTLVFASYFACARRRENCYFLEPVSHAHKDQEEAGSTIFVATIHWTLRALLVVGIAFVIMVTGTRLARLWRLVFGKEEHLRAEYALGQDSLASSATPSPSWRVRLFSWLPTVRRLSRSRPDPVRQPRSRTSSSSSSSLSWLSSRTNLPTPSSLEAAQPHRPTKPLSTASLDVSSKPHKAKSKSSKKGSHQPSADSIYNSGPDVRQSSKRQGSSSSLLHTPSDKDKQLGVEHNGKMEGKDDVRTVNDGDNDICPPGDTESLNQTTPKTATTTTTNTITKVECNELPSAALDEPESSPLRVTEPSPIQGSIATMEAAQATEDDSDFISPHDKRRRRKAKSRKARTVAGLEPESFIQQPNRDSRSKKNASLEATSRQEQVSKASKPSATHSLANQKAIKTGSKEKVTFSADTPPSPTLAATSVHPLHALNSSSIIVQTKASHKRSQSAQLPSTMPWNNHGAMHSDVAGARSGSPLCQATLPEPSLQENTRNSGDSLGFRRASAQTGPDATRATTGLIDTNNVHRWYSPFQSGLDISIDGESGTNGPTALSHGNTTIAGEDYPSNSASPSQSAVPTAGSRPTTTRLKLPPFLATPSSFFESSPRTPRIMPFSQNQQQQHHPFFAQATAAGSSAVEDFWTRTRSSSIGAPQTPLYDQVDPFDFGSGSKSAGCSRRNSIESNLMESLLTGKTRMFGDLESDANSNGGPPTSIQLTSPLVASSTITVAPVPLVPLDFLSTLNNSSSSTPTSLQLETLPEVLAPIAPSSHESHDSDIPVFVNPWDTEDVFMSTTSATNPSPFVPSTLLASNLYSPAPSIDPTATDRQTSLLRAMNSGSLSGTLASNIGVHPIVDVMTDSDPSSVLPPSLAPSSCPGSSSLLPSIPKFGPYPSVEMSLAAEVNKPPPLREIPLDDGFEKLSMEDVIKKKGAGQEKKKSHRRTDSNSNHNNNNSGHHHQHGSGHGFEQEDGNKKLTNNKSHQRTPRSGQGRSGHHKSASLGSFFPPLPPSLSDKASAPSSDKKAATSLSSSSAAKISTRNQSARDETTPSKGGEHHASKQRNTKQPPSTAAVTSSRDSSISSKSLNKARV